MSDTCLTLQHRDAVSKQLRPSLLAGDHYDVVFKMNEDITPECKSMSWLTKDNVTYIMRYYKTKTSWGNIIYVTNLMTMVIENVRV